MIKIITISREFGSGGRTIGKEIAEKLGIPCYDKDFIEKIAEETGYAKEYIADEGEYAPNSNSLVSSLIFAVVMYLMMKVMIDSCAFHISMVKVFGYRTKEIKKLYLDGNFYVIAVGAAICIPLAKKCMDLMYPLMVSNVSCGMNLHYPWQMYAIVYIAVLVLYFVMNGLLTSKLKKVTLAEVLKNRESFQK